MRLYHKIHFYSDDRFTALAQGNLASHVVLEFPGIGWTLADLRCQNPYCNMFHHTARLMAQGIRPIRDSAEHGFNVRYIWRLPNGKHA